MAKTYDYIVIGASGLVGSGVCRALRERGKSVAGAARFRDVEARGELERIGVQTVPFDALADDPESLPDARIVILEIWDPRDIRSQDAFERVWALNFDAVGRIALGYAGKADFINGSTGSVCGPHPLPRKESDPCRPDTDYGRARLAQERLLNLLCLRHGSRVVHLRYYHSNCPRSGVLRGMADSILAGRSLGAGPDERVQTIGRGDFIRCTLEAEKLMGRSPLAVNVCHTRVWTRRELAERLRSELGGGAVFFDRESGGAENSYTGDTTQMVELLGPPQEDLDGLIAAVARAAVVKD